MIKIEKQHVQFIKSDFNTEGSRLNKMSIVKFEEQLIATLSGFIEQFEEHSKLYVQFNICNPNALIFSTNIPDDDTDLICSENIAAFFGSSRESRQAFYKARILNPITEIYTKQGVEKWLF